MSYQTIMNIEIAFDLIDNWNLLPEAEKQMRMGIPPNEYWGLFMYAIEIEELKVKNPKTIDQVNSKLVSIYEEILRNLPASKAPYFRCVILNNLGNAYRQLKSLNKAENISKAIASYEEALAVWTADVYPFGYALSMWNLGVAYRNLQTANSTANIEYAIKCYQEALRFYSASPNSLEYSNILNNLGVAYSTLPSADKNETLQKSIACYEEALRAIDPNRNRLFYASIQNNLGTAYKDLPKGDKDVNLTKAIECYEKALLFRTPQVSPYDYAMTLNNLGLALSRLGNGNPNQNIQRAIDCYQEALQYRNSDHYPFEYAATMNNLGLVYQRLKDENWAANLEIAIKCYTEALKFRTAQECPNDYAMTMSNLGTTYSSLLEHDANISIMTKAIECFEESLRFRKIESNPTAYAATMMNLGNVYLRCKCGDREENTRKAIHCFTEAMRVFTPQTDPDEYSKAMLSTASAYQYRFEMLGNTDDLAESVKCHEQIRQFSNDQTYSHKYATAQMNLGGVYLLLEEGDRTANLEKAITCFRKALSYYSSDTDPFDYAHAQRGLGDAFLASNLKNKAITCYEKALRFFTPDTAPYYYARTQISLGNAFSSTPEEESKAIDAYQKAIAVTSLETSPLDYGRAHLGLGDLFFYSKTGIHTENVLKAIECYKKASVVFTPEIAPRFSRVNDWELGNAYYQAGMLEPAFHCYEQAIRAGELIYQAGLSLDIKTSEAEDNMKLYKMAVYTGVQGGMLDIENAFLMLEKGKTKTIGERLKLNMIRPTAIPDDIWNEYQEVASTLRAVQTDKDYVTHSSDPVLDYQQRRETSKKAASALTTTIQRMQKYAPFFSPEINTSTVISLLKDDKTTLVSFCITQAGSMGFTLCKEGGELQFKGINIPFFTEANLRRLLAKDSVGGWVAGGWIGDYLAFKDTNDENREQALAKWLQTISHTLEAIGKELLDPILSTLDENRKIIFLPTGDLFLLPLHAVPLSSKGGKLVCDIFDVSYAPSVQVLASCMIKAGQVNNNTLLAVDDPQDNLYESSEEVKGILKIMRRGAILLKGKAATKEKVIDNIQGKAYLHFNCHGQYNWSQPRESGLLLADGDLTLNDFLEGGVDLSATRIVTLSACETGMIDIMKGSGGEYVGLPAGFMLAGAPCVVSSLWSVPQDTTQELMVNFYFHHIIEGLNPCNALKAAQNVIRKLPGQEHPFYWAAFTVNGL